MTSSGSEGRKIDWRGLVVGFGKLLGAVVVLITVCLLLFRVLFVNYVENYQLGYKFDTRTGKTEILDQAGYIVTPPFLVKVHTVDLRPMQVCINTIQRVLNCKLVQFDKRGLNLFLSWHGRDDYEGPGTSGAANETPFQQILKNYAYDGGNSSYPFMTILKELKVEDKGVANEKLPQ